MLNLLVQCVTIAFTLGAVLADPVELKENLLFYMPSLHISPNYNINEYLGYELIHYGYFYSKCSNTHNSYAVVTSENNIFMWKKDRDLKKAVSIFYEYYILPEEENGMTLWYMLLRFIDVYAVFQSNNGEYVLDKNRRCENSDICEYRLPVRPEGLSFTEKQCRKAKMYLDELRYRLYKYVDDKIPYPLPFDYYTLGIYILTYLPISPSDINNIDPAEKLFEFSSYVKHALDIDRRLSMEKFAILLWFRQKRQEFLQTDLNDATDPEEKKKIKNRLTFHKTVTNMMLHGWMIVNNITPTNGKLKLYDQKGKTYTYDVPEIVL